MHVSLDTRLFISTPILVIWFALLRNMDFKAQFLLKKFQVFYVFNQFI